jgi:uncharacterized protein YciI
MKYLVLCSFLLLFTHHIYGQGKTRTRTVTSAGKEVQQKQYWLVILVKGQMNGKATSASALKLLENEHDRYVKKLMSEGKVVTGGMFSDDDFKKGVLIFNVDTEAEAMQLLNRDPMMSAGWLGYEIHPWWVEGNCLFK